MADADSLIIILMGVCGSGKTTLGLRLAERLQARYVEGDDHHPASNIDKMSRGIPLDGLKGRFFAEG
jgi:gluconokinase